VRDKCEEEGIAFALQVTHNAFVELGTIRVGRPPSVAADRAFRQRLPLVRKIRERYLTHGASIRCCTPNS